MKRLTVYNVFDACRKIAFSFDSYVRTKTYHEQIRGWQKLSDAVIKMEDQEIEDDKRKRK